MINFIVLLNSKLKSRSSFRFFQSKIWNRIPKEV
ncbi:hypothetical protein P872_23790 [Rhodonellum psychrophilum GCM71 = DSM 17998]|uniref:Uncharacterized protein n=1 Tax=Rhodonellum psychrophilum GCM71 = DSM 17998 TaxID=1123057 RepID=U5C4I8_9BACT|nr:hypothetical protein P872_23790 [Rhodonellum psychrophilum GCM71 = DSM 17998]